MRNRLSRCVRFLMLAGTAALAILVLLITLPDLIQRALLRHPTAHAIVQAPARFVLDLRERVRTEVAFRRTRSLVDGYTRGHAVRRLQLGAGTNDLAGWLNTDIEPGPGQALLDVTKPFPIPDRSFHYITSEHVFEHLSYEEGHAMLRECYRILLPGGRLRIATPNLSRFVGLFRNNKSDPERRYIEQKLRWHGWPRGRNPECIILNLEFSSFGHRFLYDNETLRGALEAAGFQHMRDFAPGESDDPQLRGVESRNAGPWREANAFESMVVEATRP